MQWTDLKIITKKEYEDIFDFVSAEVCPGGVQIEDYSDLEAQVEEIAHIDLIEQDLLDKDRDKIIVHHYLSPDTDRQAVRMYLEERLSQLGVGYSVEIRYINQEDWETGWKKYYHPIAVSDRLAICPSWLSTDLPGRVLKMDPGMAFGSGTHETTFLCLEALSEHIKGGEKILDIGTGSGILAIGGLLLGAKSAVGVDIDPTAVKVAAENALLNGVSDKFTVKVGNLAEEVSGKYEVITANIVANMVMTLSKDVGQFLAPGGVYISSGIIDTRRDEVLACLNGLGFTVTKVREKNGWVCIEATI